MKKKILVVDDDENIRNLLVLFLSENGYEALAASDGNDAIAKAKNELPDLILMDLMMPGVNGSGGAAVRRIKKDVSLKDIPVIFLTAYVSKDEESDEQLNINVDNIYYPAIAKPFDKAELLLKIKELL